MVQMDFSRWFRQLDELLAENSWLWQQSAFANRTLPWEESHPDLVLALMALTDAELSSLGADQQKLARWLEPWCAAAGQILELSEIAPLPKRSIAAPDRLEVGIKGRKWQQIQEFVGALSAISASTLEWCAGKGHLGRLAALVDDRAVTSLEWQPSLCEQGQQLAKNFAANQHFLAADARGELAIAEVGRHQQVIALHACGSLHTDLMRHWSESDSKSLVVAPCCYHLIDDDREYRPMSAQARSASVSMTRACLSLPLQELVTGGRSAQLRRQQQLLWRMAFDEWQREERGVDEYLSLPAVSQSLLSGGFSNFLQWAAIQKGLSISNGIDDGHWLERGQRRARQVQLMELVMHLFRRPLEVWLLLDRVLYLQESGASVSLGVFCERAVTPRNSMICASRV